MKRTIITSLFTILCLTSFAQRAEVLSRMQIINDLSQVDVTYNNEFGKYRNDDLDDPFPYSVIKVDLEGDAPDIREAKERLTLDVGRMYTVEDICKKYDNCILFLVKKSIKNVYLLCGDGCEEQLLYSGNGLEENKIYVCKVRYFKENTYSGPSKSTSQYFVLTYEPKYATIEIDGQQVDSYDGIFKKVIPCGKHKVKVSAKKYHSKETTVYINCDGTNNDTIKLIPAFGWIKVDGPQGASVYIDNEYVGNAPFTSQPLASGKHELTVKREKWLPYSAQISVKDNETSTVNPELVANFTSITLKTDKDAEIWVNNVKRGNGSVTLELTPDDYLFETRLANHRPQSLSLKITMSSDKTITLPAPIAIVGSLSVDVDPVGAKVYVDDKNVGVTPIIIQDVLIGRHLVKVTHPGMSTYTKEITIEEGKSETVIAKLSKELKILRQRPEIKDGHCSVTDEYDVISANLFKDCKNLRSITLSSDISSIGESAFSGCYQLRSITLPQSIKTIEPNTFYWCAALREVTIPDGVTSIGANAFTNCYGIESITLPSSVTSIAPNAFTDCKSLKHIYIPAGTLSTFQKLLPSLLKSKLKEK